MPLQNLQSMRAVTFTNVAVKHSHSEWTLESSLTAMLQLKKEQIGRICESSVHGTFLARQGLSLRGSGDESDSNLLQLLLLRTDDFPALANYLERKQLKYVSHDVQNEFLSIMALQVLREITANLQIIGKLYHYGG